MKTLGILLQEKFEDDEILNERMEEYASLSKKVQD